MKTDFLGNELEVGDLVIYGSGGGSYKEHLKRGVISDLKPKHKSVSIIPLDRYKKGDYNHVENVFPKNIYCTGINYESER